MATWIMSIASSTGYFGILLLMFVENVFPPVPSEVIMPLAGYMAAQGKIVALRHYPGGHGRLCVRCNTALLSRQEVG